MISLDQIRTLETKVHKAVSLLTTVQEENQILKNKLAGYETRIDELEFMIEEFREEQSEIEQGIISALNHLDNLEDAVDGLKDERADGVTAPPAPDVPHTETHVVAPEEESDLEIEEEQHFQQPSPVSYEKYESAREPEEQQEQEEQPRREQQLDIF